MASIKERTDEDLLNKVGEIMAELLYRHHSKQAEKLDAAE